MKRQIISKLKEWKDSPRRKPLVMQGARQVGKTWAVKEFARTCYRNLVYLNFEQSKNMQGLFEADYDIKRIMLQLSAHSGEKIVPGETLIFFDEVQEAKGGLTFLKYFNEDAPEHHVIVAGSLLGIAIHEGYSFPVGKVNFMDMYPMSFTEFLDATENEDLSSLIREKRYELLEPFHDKLRERLKQYLYVGGMPEVVEAFRLNGDWAEVREIQNEILTGYEDDFSKHAPAGQLPRIRQIWRSIPRQLSRENRKFLFGLIKEGARAREYEQALEWLYKSGLLHPVYDVSAPSIPLSAYINESAFKIFMNDVGLLSAMSGLDVRSLLEGNAIFREFKGSLTEQYVFGELRRSFPLYYWSKPGSTQEVDFLIQDGSSVVPVEVKAEVNVKSKSLKTFVEEYHIPHAIRTSLLPYREQEWLTNIPLFCV